MSNGGVSDRPSKENTTLTAKESAAECAAGTGWGQTGRADKKSALR